MQKVEITEIPKKLLQKLRFCRIIRVQKRTDVRLKGEREMKTPHNEKTVPLKLKRKEGHMQTFKIKAYKGKDGKKALCIDGFVTSRELNAIKRKMEKMQEITKKYC